MRLIRPNLTFTFSSEIVGREGLSKLFTSINEGMQLNDQEKRNAIACKFGNSVRKLVFECDAGFAKMYSASNINRRFPDEYIVTVAE